MFFMDDFELIGFIEQGMEVLWMYAISETQDPEMTDFYEHGGSISIDDVASDLEIAWEQEGDRPDTAEEWQALAVAIVAIERLGRIYGRRHARSVSSGGLAEPVTAASSDSNSR
jgi:hypothetical protein